MPLDVIAPGVGVEDEALEDMGGRCYRKELGIRSAMLRKERQGRARREPAGQRGERRKRRCAELMKSRKIGWLTRVDMLY